MGPNSTDPEKSSRADSGFLVKIHLMGSKSPPVYSISIPAGRKQGRRFQRDERQLVFVLRVSYTDRLYLAHGIEITPAYRISSRFLQAGSRGGRFQRDERQRTGLRATCFMHKQALFGLCAAHLHLLMLILYRKK